MFRDLTIIIFLFCIFFSPVSAELVQFWPGSDSVATADVMEICDGTGGRVLFATSNGLSIFDGEEWTTMHAMPKDNRGYLEGIPLDDYIQELEYDHLNNLWIGYANGIQIYNGYSKPFTIRQTDGILFDVSVNKLKRQGRIMWIATGDSGVFYYYNGRFSWVQPGEPAGLTANRISDLEVDYSTDILYASSASGGQYFYSGGEGGLENISFQKISDPLINRDMTEIVSSPLGGVIFFNSTDAVFYRYPYGGEHIFNTGDLSPGTNKILDISVSKNGRYIIGTDNGIFCMDEGGIFKHLTRFEGLSDNYVDSVFVDKNGRWWFNTKRTVGYYFEPEFIALSSIEIKPDSSSAGYPLIDRIIK